MSPDPTAGPAPLQAYFPKRGWEQIAGEFKKGYMHHLSAFLDECRGVCPENKSDIFRAYHLTSLQEVRVVIVGQDPYPHPWHAKGLAFSVPAGLRPHPPSLRNIYHELQTDRGIAPPIDGDLTRWAEQGVLLLNRTLTVGEGAPGSHRKRGWWARFTSETVKAISAQRQAAAFVLWGRDAQELIKYVNGHHGVICGAHPSRSQVPHPGEDFDPSRHFFGGKYFSNVNEFLVTNHREPVDW